MDELHSSGRRAQGQVLVIAPPGNYRRSLVGLLSSLPGVDTILTSGDAHQLDALPERTRPEIILLGAQANVRGCAGVRCSIESARRRWPQAQVVLLTDHSAKKNSGGLAQADYRLAGGVSAGDFLGLIRRLLVDESIEP